ncbi:hypothetical protein GCM10010405_09600 [Streptomyces macrosporus]|uniref:Uncharacterized protein n=1 Tax=Streptomyces macrosporus TaxID=44032 RepID=A0ABN3JI01_9ACTN
MAPAERRKQTKQAETARTADPSARVRNPADAGRANDPGSGRTAVARGMCAAWPAAGPRTRGRAPTAIRGTAIIGGRPTRPRPLADSSVPARVAPLPHGPRTGTVDGAARRTRRRA